MSENREVVDAVGEGILIMKKVMMGVNGVLAQLPGSLTKMRAHHRELDNLQVELVVLGQIAWTTAKG